MKRFHAAGICDCCDAPACPRCGELVEACDCGEDRHIDIGTCQSCGRYHDARVRTCPCGGYVG